MPDTYRELQEQAVNQLRAGSGQNPRASVVPIRSDYRTDAAMCLTSVSSANPNAMIWISGGKNMKKSVV